MKVSGVFLDMIDVERPNLFWGSAIPEQVALVWIRKSAEQVMGTSQFTAFLYGFCFRFCLWVPSLASKVEIK